MEQNQLENRVADLEGMMAEYAQQNKDLKLKVTTLEGKNLKLLNQIESMKSQIEDIQTRSMNKNLLFHNIPEKNREDCKSVLKKFINDNLKLGAGMASRITLDVAHRLGKKRTNGLDPRPIVASFTTRDAVFMIKNHAKNLDKDKKYRITEQLPREVRARRNAQIPKIKAIRDEDPDAKVSFQGDKLVHEGTVLDPEFNKDPIRDVPGNQITRSFADLHHSTVTHACGSTFQGHAMFIDSLRSAQAARDALFQEFAVADSTHVIYAYKLTDPDSHMTISGHSDDGEWTAGAQISGLLTAHNDVFVAVTRKYGGVDVGRKRFALIKKAATGALNRLGGFGVPFETDESAAESDSTHEG